MKNIQTQIKAIGITMGTPIVIAKKTSDTTQDIVLHSQFANRHGLIAGATGTGKTITLKVLAESFSRIGVPVFLADAKGDVSSIAKAGSTNPKFEERIKSLGVEEHTNYCHFIDWSGWSLLSLPRIGVCCGIFAVHCTVYRSFCTREKESERERERDSL